LPASIGPPVIEGDPSYALVTVTDGQRTGVMPAMRWDRKPEGVPVPAEQLAAIDRSLTAMNEQIQVVLAYSQHLDASTSDAKIWTAVEEATRQAGRKDGPTLDAFYSPDFFRREWVGVYIAKNGSWFWNPSAEFGDYMDARLLDDGRVALLFEGDLPETGFLVVVVQNGDGWLIDEIVELNPDGHEGS
jgi:hypothetical protein